MSRPIIEVDRLSKAYRIGLKDEIPDTLVGAVSSLVRSPVKNLNRLRRLDTFSIAEAEQSEDTLWALKDVSFQVQEGEVLGIIGRNGAGKSTLLKILSRITEPTYGRAVIRGRVSSLLEVGTGFHPELTGRENIYLNGTILGMTKREIDRKFDEIVDFSGVEKFLDTPVKRYSSGMSVRLAFAVAAHLEPEVLIIDEVLAVGDAEFQKKCLGKMQDVASHGRTVLFVSHNMVAVRTLCDWALLLDNGTVAGSGAVSMIINQYLEGFSGSNDQGIVSDTVERIGTGDGKITRVRLLDNDNADCRQLLLGQRLRVCFEFDLFKAADDVNFGVYVRTKDDLVLVVSQTTDRHGQSTALASGRHSVEAELDVTLLPGKYWIDVGIHHENGAAIDHVVRALEFTVLRVADGDDGHYRWNAVLGHIRASASWGLPQSQTTEMANTR